MAMWRMWRGDKMTPKCSNVKSKFSRPWHKISNIHINICLWIFLHIRLLFSHKKLELYVTKSETLVNYFHQLAYNEMIVIFSLRNDQITSSHKALHVWDSHDPILRGHFCLSIGKSSRFMMQVAMIVSLWE